MTCNVIGSRDTGHQQIRLLFRTINLIACDFMLIAGPDLQRPSLTTGRRWSFTEMMKLAWLSSTTTTATGSSGTMLPATTRSQSSVKMSKVTSTLPDRLSPSSKSLNFSPRVCTLFGLNLNSRKKEKCFQIKS